jgi:hypothetical protein
MAGKSDAMEFSVLRLVFNGVASTELNYAATGGTTSIWVGLMTADPTDAASTANEGGYTAYTRVKTDRSSAASTGWGVTSGTGASNATVAPVTNVDFPQVATTSTGTFTHFGCFNTSDAGSSRAFYVGTVTPNINFSQNVTPRIGTGSSITED